jgi:hypothetical protein
MGEYVAGAVLEVSVSFRRVAFHEFEDEVCGVFVEWGPADEGRATGYFFVEEDGVGFGLVVGWEAGEHFEDEDAEGVPVDGFVVSLLADDLFDRRLGEGLERVVGMEGKLVYWPRGQGSLVCRIRSKLCFDSVLRSQSLLL